MGSKVTPQKEAVQSLPREERLRRVTRSKEEGVICVKGSVCDG